MKTDTTNELMMRVRADLDREDRQAEARAKVGIGIRAVLIVFVAAYISWIMGAVTQLDAPALTRLAALNIEERLPDLRAKLRDQAIALAPDLTDQARDLLLQLPVRLREHVEATLVAKTEELIARFETDLDTAVTTVVEDQIDLVRGELSDAGPEEQLDAIVLGVSDAFRETMIEAVDELYYGYSAEIRRLNADLEHLLRGEILTEAEQIDKRLIEAWMVLAHKHELADPGRLIAGF